MSHFRNLKADVEMCADADLSRDGVGSTQSHLSRGTATPASFANVGMTTAPGAAAFASTPPTNPLHTPATSGGENSAWTKVFANDVAELKSEGVSYNDSAEFLRALVRGPPSLPSSTARCPPPSPRGYAPTGLLTGAAASLQS